MQALGTPETVRKAIDALELLQEKQRQSAALILELKQALVYRLAKLEHPGFVSTDDMDAYLKRFGCPSPKR